MNHRGFIALTSVLILSLVLLALVAGAGMKILYARFDALERENESESEALAESCFAIAELHLAADPAYAGGETVAIGSDACSIGAVREQGTEALFTVSAEYHHAVSVYDESVPI